MMDAGSTGLGFQTRDDSAPDLLKKQFPFEVLSRVRYCAQLTVEESSGVAAQEARMPIKAWQNISPLAWCLATSAIANVVTMVAVLYLAFGTPKVIVSDGAITVYSGSSHGFSIDDRSAVRVQVVK